MGTTGIGTTRALVALAVTALLAGCVSGPQPRSASRSIRPAPPPSVSFRQCAARLDSLQVRYSPLPSETRGGGCGLIDTVKLLDFGTPTTNLGPMTCPLAANFAAWARYGVVPAARLHFGSEIVRIETFGTYACRNIVGNPGMAGKRSEHAHANAVDVSAFVLADGRRISLEKDWAGDSATRAFLRTVRDSACKRFRTVLSPDYNAAHYNHFHFDMGGRGGFCR